MAVGATYGLCVGSGLEITKIIKRAKTEYQIKHNIDCKSFHNYVKRLVKINAGSFQSEVGEFIMGNKERAE